MVGMLRAAPPGQSCQHKPLSFNVGNSKELSRGGRKGCGLQLAHVWSCGLTLVPTCIISVLAWGGGGDMWQFLQFIEED